MSKPRKLTIIIIMFIILIVFSLILKSECYVPEACFYSQKINFFNGVSVSTLSHPSGYNFDVTWEYPQMSIINSSIFYTAGRNKAHILLSYTASIISTSYTGAKIFINPLNGSEILSITLNIVILRQCSGNAFLIPACTCLQDVEFNSIQLGSISSYDFSVYPGINFQSSTSRYKAEVFINDFDAYTNNGSQDYAFNARLGPITLNSNFHTIQQLNPPSQLLLTFINKLLKETMSLLKLIGYLTVEKVSGYNTDYIFINRIRLTYVLVDILSFLITPITQNTIDSYLSNQMQINVYRGFSPNADKKCMVGIKRYILFSGFKQDINISILNSTNYSLTYHYQRAIGINLVPSMFCFGFCKEGTGRTNTNTCGECPKFSLTCSNTSYALNCLSGYYLQPSNNGVQICSFCIPACKICSNYSECIECEPTNLLGEQKNCRKCPSNNSRLAGAICSSVPGCSLALSIGGLSVCRLCSIQERFLIDPIDEKCVCKSGFQLKNGKCIDYCGDGIIMDLECDDGNTANSDGCSAECKQERGYKCSILNASLVSKCVFIDKISLQLVSLQRANLQNKFFLELRIIPDYLYGLSPKFIESSFQTNLSLNINSVTVKESSIILSVSFDEEIENKQARLIMNINDPLIVQKYVSLMIQFLPKYKLTIIHRINISKTIKYLYSSIILLAFLIFLVSLCFHKMIGLQTILPFQIIYFSYLLNQDDTQLFSLFSYYAGSAINFIFYFNGGSIIQSQYSNITFISQNQNFSLILIFCLSYSNFTISFMGLCLRFLKYKQQLCNQKFEKWIVFWHNRVSLPLFCCFLVPILIIKSTLFNQQKKGQNSYYILLSIECIILIILIFYEWRAAFFIKSTIVQPIKKHPMYIPVFLSALFLVALFLSAGFVGIISFVEPWLLGLCWLGLVGFIYVRPYKGVLHNAGVIAGIIQIITYLVCSILRSYDSSKQIQENQILVLLICFSLALINTILGLIRVVSEIFRHYRQKITKKQSLYTKGGNEIRSVMRKTATFQTRYQTAFIIPQYLKQHNINILESVPIQNFHLSKKQQNLQLKRFLIQKMKAVKKDKQSINIEF